MHSSVSDFKIAAKKTLDFLHDEFKGLQVGVASPAMVENITFSAYGSSQSIKAVASITVEGPQSLMITPWDKGLLNAIEKAIRDDAALGLSPVNNGVGVRLNIPPLTKERREGLTKVVAKMGEEAKVGIRKNRQHAMDAIKNDEELSEDMVKSAEIALQKEVDQANKDIESSVKTKQADILKV